MKPSTLFFLALPLLLCTTSLTLAETILFSQPDFSSLINYQALTGTQTPDGRGTWDTPDADYPSRPGAYGLNGSVYSGYGPEATQYIEIPNSDADSIKVEVSINPSFAAGEDGWIGAGFLTGEAKRLLSERSPGDGRGSLGFRIKRLKTGEFAWEIIADGDTKENASGVSADIMEGQSNLFTFTYDSKSGKCNLSLGNDTTLVAGAVPKDETGTELRLEISEIRAVAFQFGGSADSHDTISSISASTLDRKKD